MLPDLGVCSSDFLLYFDCRSSSPAAEPYFCEPEWLEGLPAALDSCPGSFLSEVVPDWPSPAILTTSSSSSDSSKSCTTSLPELFKEPGTWSECWLPIPAAADDGGFLEDGGLLASELFYWSLYALLESGGTPSSASSLSDDFDDFGRSSLNGLLLLLLLSPSAFDLGESFAVSNAWSADAGSGS